ncbi:MAG: transposase [Acidimicrobiia bacterium]
MSDTSEVGHRRDGRLEGTNNKLGVLKRVAFGFVNTDNFGRRALLQMPAMAASP